MTYELAKKLKDAGFSQTGCEGCGATWLPSPKNPEIIAYEPTLSELIEACGEGEFQLNKHKDGTCAAVIMKGEMPDYDWQKGLTPEEAVAKLWLALREKKDVENVKIPLKNQ